MPRPSKSISLNFSAKNPTDSNDFSIIHFAGNHWDDIYYFPKHYQIGLIRAGEGYFTVKETEFTLVENDTYFIKPDLVHKGKPNPDLGWEVSLIQFKPEIIDEISDEGFSFSVFDKFLSDNDLSPELKKLLNHFEEELSLEEAKNLVYDFLLECSDVLPIPQKSRANYQAIQRAKSFIESNYQSKFSLEDLADEARRK